MAPPIGAKQAPTLAQWEQAMRHGNQASQAGHAGVALRHTRDALAIAQALLGERMVSAPDDTADAAGDVLAALVVSHHLLADLYHAAHLPDQAAAHVCRAHAVLMALLVEGAADTALRHAAWRHSRETHAALLLFIRERGPHPAVTQALHDHTNLPALCGQARH